MKQETPLIASGSVPPSAGSPVLSRLSSAIAKREEMVQRLLSFAVQRFPAQQIALRELFDLDRYLLILNAVFMRNAGQGLFQKISRYMAQPVKVQAVIARMPEIPVSTVLNTDIRTLVNEIGALRESYDEDPGRLIEVIHADMLGAGNRSAVEALKTLHQQSNQSALDVDRLMFRHYGLRQGEMGGGWMAGFHVPVVSSMSWPHINPYQFKERGPYGMDSLQVRSMVSAHPHLAEEMEELRREYPGPYFMMTPTLRESREGFLLTRVEATGFTITGIDFCNPVFVAALQYLVLACPIESTVTLPDLGGSIYRSVAVMDEGDRMALLEG